jgi:hypothetical protein
MKKLSTEKRNRLIMVIATTVATLAALWFGLISWQEKHLTELGDRKSDIQTRLDKIQQVVKNADLVDAELAESTKTLANLEENMTSGEPYIWMHNKMKAFKTAYKVEIPQITGPEIKEVNVLAKFPYKQASFVVGGTAFYHDLGKFLADFENQFPLFRVVNLDVQQAPLQADMDKEKLSFKMDVLTLVKPGGI